MAARIAYPLMTAVCSMWFFICLMDFWGSRRWLALVLAVFYLLATTAFGLLSVSVGDSFRLLGYPDAIAIVRMVWLSAALVGTLYTGAYIWRRWRKWRQLWSKR